MPRTKQPKGPDALDKTAIECANKKISYGHYMRELDAKRVVVVQNDGVPRQRAGDRVKLIEKGKATPLRMTERGKKAHHAAIKLIENDIQLHQTCIETEQKEIDQHIGCIRMHQQAIEALDKELEQEKEFIKAFEEA